MKLSMLELTSSILQKCIQFLSVRRLKGEARSMLGVGLEGKMSRDRIVLATKVSQFDKDLPINAIKISIIAVCAAAYSSDLELLDHPGSGPKCLDARNITEAIDNSLSRIGTDYIDLYQIHWPDRYVPMFGETEYDPTRQFCSVPIEEQLEALGRAVDAGKVRSMGLSNETPYGVMTFLRLAKGVTGCPKIVSVQNSYNLLCRSFNFGLAECCHYERISLLAYSPLAMGILSGKYFSSDGGPEDARMNLFRGKYAEGESRYNLTNSTVKASTKKYLDIAEKYALHPVSLAIAFVLKHPLVASAVFGATKPWQLKEVLKAFEIELGPEVISEINEVHVIYPNPCP